ncbi:ASST-domain-containing protein [Xylariaceae sp. FL0804]|nr:ASST-domain-containing protein [Xylariaceae sp. FL0804]
MRSALSGATAALLVGGTAAAATYWVNDYEGYMNGTYGDSPAVSFKSSNLEQPLFQISRDPADSGFADGYIIMATNIGDQDAAVMVLRGEDLSLVYALPRSQGDGDANIQMLDGEAVLTFFGESVGSNTANVGYIYSNQYEEMYTTNTVNMSVESDGHEQYITYDNTVIMTAYVSKPYDLTEAGGDANGTLLDSCFEEVDFKTNTSIFTWCASDHFSPSLSLSSPTGGYYGTQENSTHGPMTEEGVRINLFGDGPGDGGNGSTGPGGPGGSPGGGGATSAWDAYHINAISKVSGGNYLVSLRLLGLGTLIDGATGAPIWNLGYTLNDFADLSGGNATDFAFEHHIRFASADDETRITMFDNHESGESRGLLLRLDYDAMTVEAVTQAYHPRAVYASAMGSELLLPGSGNLFTGWGTVPTFTEHTQAGDCVTEVWWTTYDTSGSGGGGMGGGASNYRTFWVPTASWTGNPTTSPDVAVEDDTVYVSWNGATEVASWVVYDSDDVSVATADSDGFETAIDISGTSGDVYVVALDKSGDILGTSATASAKKRSTAFKA